MKFCADNFVINDDDYINFFNYMKDLYPSYDFVLNSALNVIFNQVIFYSTYNLDDYDLKKTLIYYPLKRKTYLLNTNEFNYFKNKYFPNFKLFERSPELFSFQIPFPEIYYYRENHEKYEDRYNINIGRYKSQTFKNIENYSLRFNPNSSLHFDSIFQKDFLSIYNLSKGYKEYLKLIMDIEPKTVNINNLVEPYYLLDKIELIKLIEIGKEIDDKLSEEALRENEEKMNKEHGNWFDSQMDELNRQAFEDDESNYWNID